MKKLVVLACSATLLFAALPAFAQTSPVSDWLKVFDASGTVVFSATATQASELANGASFVYTLPGVAVDATKFGSPTVLLEPNVPGQTAVSDTFGVYPTPNGGFVLAFTSDAEGTPAAIWGEPTALPETGLPVDATQYLDPGLRANHWTAQFWSDAETTPDGGATAGLLGLGFAGLAAIRRMVK